MKIIFKQDQYQYLQTVLSKDRVDYWEILQKGYIEQLIFDLDEDFIEELREWCIEMQIKVGFDIEYELNDSGKILENLIDLLYR
ncbi:hypothetical protein HDF19_13290 [Mucilaginibacter sp. E4BP6]|uniref:hypothetical protein n=1 Tax=Mucilaginibacter sp. E4BP6 TaxID=2723089 RepID=UPI0015CCDA25|nr:hypothetical protein [Mucilaginibacter sp. E4BP6]NYE66046.1 hypothetical protein [Mucilaginibacter sp. E4BP6]